MFALSLAIVHASEESTDEGRRRLPVRIGLIVIIVIALIGIALCCCFCPGCPIHKRVRTCRTHSSTKAPMRADSLRSRLQRMGLRADAGTPAI